MKKQLTFLFLLPLLNSFGQEPGIAQFWNNYGFINPATDGTLYRHQAAISGRSDLYKHPSFTDYQATAVYGVHLEKLSSGLGVHYRHNRGYTHGNRIGLNYNYQFRVAGITHISLGAGVDYESLTGRTYYEGVPAVPPSISITSSWILNTGFLLRHGPMQFGGSITALNQPKRDGPWIEPGFPVRRAFLHLEYTIKIGEQVKLTPRLLSEVVSAFTKSPQLGELTLVAEGCYDQRFRFGLGYQVQNEQGIVTTGWDFAKRYRIGYALTIDVSGPNYNDPAHELVLGIQLGKID